MYSFFDSGEAPFFAGQTRKLCDQKQIVLSGGKNAAADFFMFTDVPRSAHITGIILNDLANEFDPTAPAFGEKFAPPNLPVSFRTWEGDEVSRTYSDRWGMYNALVPSTYTNNLPSSSGISPNMLTSCMNDPGPINVGGVMVTDPAFKREYTQFCYTWQYMPGTTTYLDTPILPNSAFTSIGQFPLDCEFADGTPVIWSTSGSVTGPYVALPGDTLQIVSAGDVDVNNPDFNGTNQDTITRDYGFGAVQGTVTIDGNPATITFWDNDLIEVNIATSGQLEIKRANGLSTQTGIHVTVASVGENVVGVIPGGSIQTAIDSAPAGSIVLVPPGTFNEALIMWKPIRLQGSGASTVINASSSAGTNVIQDWRTNIEALIVAGSIDLLPSQGTVFTDTTLLTEQAAGIIVLAKDDPAIGIGFTGTETRIDGISINGSSIGGGIIVNGFAHNLEISNNRLFNNSGVYGGGIRIGHAIYSENNINQNLNIHNNYVAQNSSFVGAGAGISLYWGSDDYTVANNYVCGNFSTGDGAGIAHQGRSLGNNQITGNSIFFNQSFNQGVNVAGGGIFVGGTLGLGGGITLGSGSVAITDNLIQGNNAGAGNGGGISLALIDGVDALTTPYPIVITGNTIVNNVTGLAGGGISIQDAINVDISNNTIAHNDSTATAGEAFCDIATGLVCNANQSTPRAAGIASFEHSISLAGVVGAGFSNPVMNSNIIWENRSFYFDITDPTIFGLVPNITGGDVAVFDDLAVYPSTAGNLNPLNGVLTNRFEDTLVGYDVSNTSDDPLFILDYFNGTDGTGIQQGEFTTISSISVQPAFDEGGNFIEVRYGPLSPVGNYTALDTAPPILISPNSSGTSTNPTYIWNEVVGATQYYLWVNDSTGNVINEFYTPAQVNCNGVTCSITHATTLANGSAKWWIQASNPSANGSWGSGQSFTVGTPPSAAPILVSPNNIGTANLPTYIWNEVADATHYYLWVNDSTGTPVQLPSLVAATICNGVTCNVNPGISLAIGSAMWWVQASNTAGNSPWSSGQSFAVGLPPSTAPTLLSPNGGTTTVNPTYIWSEVANATDYYLWVNDSAGTPVQVTYPATTICSGGTCVVNTGIPLAVGNAVWWIQASNTAGNSPWSSAHSFTVVP